MSGIIHRPLVTRIEALWLLLDEHFPGEHTEARAYAIDDLYIDLLDQFIDDEYHVCSECGDDL